MLDRLECKFFFFLLVSLFVCSLSADVFAQNAGSTAETNEIISIKTTEKANKIILHIKGSKPFVSTSYELPNPKRIVIDLANVSLAENTKKNISIPFKYAIDTVKGVDPTIVRIELFPNDFESYSSNQNNEELILSINIPSQHSDKLHSGNINTDSPNQSIVQYTHHENKDFVHIITGKNKFKYNANAVTSDNKYSLQIDFDNIAKDDFSEGTVNAGGVIDKINISKRGLGARILIISKYDKPFIYNVKEAADGLEIAISEESVSGKKVKNDGKSPSIANQLPEINPLESQISPQAREQQMQDAFNFSGYNKDRITVEFQKMDLHNVFNFLRQVSGVNIVVDESVQGSLTLVLDDVPWDFALDIILNLKNLEKEERFNTIVIYPKGKGFVWPEQAENNLSFEADSAVIEKESLVVQQQERQSPDRIEAKQILLKAQAAEKAEDYENAVLLYEQAFEKWNDNVQIANKISSIYLGPLRQNAKALYFTQKALGIDPKNQFALLQGGIASANMQNYTEAERFFSQSVRGPKPSKEAFLNFAAFKEDRKNYSESLSIINEHDRQYGKSLDSMLAAARVNDKSGNAGQAVRCYRELLNSGYRMPADLQKFVEQRIAQ